ncbi:hypothetical protein ACLB1Q_31290 [Escherichia coli]
MCEQFGVWGEKSFMGKTYDGLHRISFLIRTDGAEIEHVFDRFQNQQSPRRSAELVERTRLITLLLPIIPCWLRLRSAHLTSRDQMHLSLSPATPVSNPLLAER